MKKTQNTKNTTNTTTAEAVASSNAESVQTSKQAESKQAEQQASKQAKKQASKQAESKQAESVKQSTTAESKQAESKQAESVKIEKLYSDMKAVIDLNKFSNADSLACNELNFNEFVINQVIDNNLVALVKIYAHKNRYDLLLNKSRLTVLFNNALKANELLNVDFNAKKLETKKQYVVELNLAQLEQYIIILFDLVKKQEQTTKQ